VSPGLSVGVESGATSLASRAAAASLERLGRATMTGHCRVRAAAPRTSVMAGIRLFGGGLFAGAARPLDRHSDRRAAGARSCAVAADL
jgi:hypothetical protein